MRKELTHPQKKQALTNLSAVLQAANSSIDNVVKVNIYLTNMQDFAAVNTVYAKVFTKEPKPSRTCVAVFQLPLGTGMVFFFSDSSLFSFILSAMGVLVLVPWEMINYLEYERYEDANYFGIFRC